MVTSNFRYESDFSKVTADLKNLVRQATETNTAFAQLNKTAASMKMEAARSFSAQAGFAGFRTQIVDLTGATEGFGQALMRNKLTMKQYFSEAAKAYKKDSQAYKLSMREVARANSTVAALGDVDGRRKGILITPETIDTKNLQTKMALASKQYEVFNHLVNRGATELVNWGKNTQWAGRQLTVGLTVPMGIFATKAMTAFKDVEKEITRFRKVYGSDLTNSVEGATDKMLAQIQAIGQEFSMQFGIASKETIALAADLAAAGFEGQKLAAAVTQTTRLMVLGEVDRQEAMKATMSLQTAFKQSSEELAQSVDFLNAVENQTSASLQDLTEAIPKTGPVIRALGGDIKDLSVLMTALREGGIASGEGANAIKSGMASLISPTKAASEKAKQFGIDLQGVVTRNKGDLMPMLLDFQEQLRGLDDFGKAQVIESIFGKYQFARISALFDNLNQRGSQTVKMIDLMNMSADELAKKSYSELKAQENSAATRMAAIQQQLTNQLIKVGAELAETLLPSLQSGLEFLSKIVDGFNNLPGPIKNFAKIIGGAVTVAGPLLMLAGMMGNLVGNTIKFGMSIVNMFKRITGNPVQQLEILSDQELAAKIAAEQLTGAYVKQKTSVDALNKSLQMYVANLRAASAVAPPGSYSPIRPRRFQTGGVVFASNGMTEGRINGYGGGDKVPALLEPGEFVINKQSSQKFAPILKSINNGSYGKHSKGKTDMASNTWAQDRAVFPGGDVINPKKSVLSVLQAAVQANPSDKYLRSLLEESLEQMKVASKFNPGAQYGSARSHIVDTGTPVVLKTKDGERVTIRKQFAGTTMLEQNGYNSLIQAMGEKLGNNPDLLPSGFRNREKILSILSDTAAPLDPRKIKVLDGFFSDVLANKDMQKAFNALPGKQNNKWLQESKSFTERLSSAISRDEMEIAKGTQKGYKRYAEIRRNQFSASMFTTLSDDALFRLTGTKNKALQAKELYRISGSISAPLAGATSLDDVEKVISSRIRMISERITGTTALTSEEKRAIQSRSDYIETKTVHQKMTEKFTKDTANQVIRDSSIGENLGLKNPSSAIEESIVKSRAGKQTAAATSPSNMKRMIKLFGRYAGRFALGGQVLRQIMSKKEREASIVALEKIQKGFRVDDMSSMVGPDALTGLRKRVLPSAHDKTLYRGHTMGIDDFEKIMIGETVSVPGSQSYSVDPLVAERFANMNMPGGDYRRIRRFYQEVNPKTGLMQGNVKIGEGFEQEAAVIRERRIDALQNFRQGLGKTKNPAEMQAARARYDELNAMLKEARFSYSPEIRAAKKEFETIRDSGILMDPEVQIQNARRELAEVREYSRKHLNNKPVIYKLNTPKGTMELPVSDLVGGGRYIEDVGYLDEMESILTNAQIKVRNKYTDSQGRGVIEGDIIEAARFALGGMVQKRAKGGVIFGHGMDDGGRLSGYGGGDTVPAMLEPGEFVINKKSSAKHAPLLKAINRDQLPGFQQGGPTGRLQKFSASMGGGSGMMMNAMFLPMTMSMIGQMEGTMKQMTIAVTALQTLVVLIQAAAVMQSGLLKLGGAKQTIQMASSMNAPAAQSAAQMGGGRLTQLAAASKAGELKGLAAIGGKAAGLLFNPITAAVAVTGVALVGGIMWWKSRVEDLAKDSRSMYTQATEMAKVYNIEIMDTTKALEQNSKFANELGINAANVGKGIVDKDYANAVSENFKDLIIAIDNTGTSQQKLNMLSAQYASLIAQGFSKEQAAETVAEIARQTNMTAEYSALLPTLKANINDAADAMSVLQENVLLQIESLGTATERVSALTAAYLQLVNASGQAPDQFLSSIKAISEGAQSGDLETMVKNQLETQGMDTKAQSNLLGNLFGEDEIDWASKKGKKIGAVLLQGMGLGVNMSDLMNSGKNLNQAIMDVSEAAAVQATMLEVDQNLDEIISQVEENIDAINDYYDAAISGIEREIRAIQKGAEEKQDALEKEADALNNRKDALEESTNFYIDQLQKEYEAEQFYQKQRETALGGLQSLSQGDIFGYLQSQQRMASDSSQFGREQAISQIEETSEAAQKALDDRLKKNRESQETLNDTTEEQIRGKQDEIANLNAARSADIKAQKDALEMAKSMKDQTIVSSRQMEKLQTTLKTINSTLPKDLEIPFKTVGENAVQEFDKITETSVANIAATTGASVKKLAKVVEEAFGEMFATTSTDRIIQALGFKIDPKTGDVTGSSEAGKNIIDNKGTKQNPYKLTSNSLPEVDGYSENEYVQLKNGEVYYLYKSRRGQERWIQSLNRGGKVMPMKYNMGVRGVPGFGNYDKVPALLTPGETVLDNSTSRRNKYSLAAMAAGVSFDTPNANSYGKLGSVEINKNIEMGGVNININGTSLSAEQLQKSVIKALEKATNSLETSRRY